VAPALEQGAMVFADRWTYSALAYRLAEQLESIARKRMREYVHRVNEPCLRPDVGIYIDITPELSIKRRGRKPEVYTAAHLRRVRREYLRLVGLGELVRVDGSRAVRKVLSDVTRLLSLERNSA